MSPSHPPVFRFYFQRTRIGIGESASILYLSLPLLTIFPASLYLIFLASPADQFIPYILYTLHRVFLQFPPPLIS